jgi:hypothetical protein
VPFPEVGGRREPGVSLPVVDHVRRVTRAVLHVAQAVESGARPSRDLVSAAFASEGALDNVHPEWKRCLLDLSLVADAASDPWPPHASEHEQRLAVLAAAEPYLKAMRDLLADG